jgi:AcrR family transcriptional regulator
MSAEASAAINKVDAPAAKGGSERDIREGAMEGVLIACGELGFRETSVRSILEHSGGHRAQFYHHFGSKEDCFAQAYGVWIERLCVSLLKAAATAPGWEGGVREAIVRLFRFVTERPAIARALFVEVQIAGEPALARHEAAVERLAAAIDSARAEVDPAAAPPEATGVFVVGGIEACVAEALSAGDPGRVWDALPELMHFAAGSYFGNAEAEGAFERASEMLERDQPQLAAAVEDGEEAAAGSTEDGEAQ